MQRIKNPLQLLPSLTQSLMAFGQAVQKDTTLPAKLPPMIHLRASQINGCSVCVLMHARELKKLDETEERLIALAAWRDTTLFTDAERAALAFTEHVTRIADTSEPVPEHVWAELEKHFDETQRTAIAMHIASINLWNRLNVATGQVAVR